MKARALFPVVFVAVWSGSFVACESQMTAKALEEPLGSDALKDDSFRSPTSHGELAFGQPATTELTSDHRHHAWTFELAGPASVSLVTRPPVEPGVEVDTVLYLYREGASGWGRYIARNDDHGETLFSKLDRDLEAGRYRVLVKGYAKSTMGPFSLESACDGDGCPALARCLLGNTSSELFADPAFAGRGFQLIEDAALYPASTQAQLVAAAKVLDPSVSDLAQAMAASSRVERFLVERVATGALYHVVTLRDGDDRTFGAAFRGETVEIVAEVRDSQLIGCSLLAAPGGAQVGGDCGAAGPCGAGLECIGRQGGLGRCVPSTDPSGAGAGCGGSGADVLPVACPGDELVCGGLGATSQVGLCVPTWLRGRFSDQGVVSLEGRGLVSRSQLVYGLASVAMDVSIAVELVNVVPSTIVVRLENPAGTIATVWNGPALLEENPDLDSDNFIELIEYVSGYPGDESANGTYTLRVESLANNPGGEIADWHLTVTSRFD